MKRFILYTCLTMKSSSSFPHPKNSLENPLTFRKSRDVIKIAPPKNVLYNSLETDA